MKASDLLARLKRTQEDAAALKSYWQGILTCLPPSNLDLQNLARRFPLDSLVIGMEAYAAEISKKNKLIAEGKEHDLAFTNTTQNAVDYIAGTAHHIEERENPDEQRPLTARRMRKDLADMDSHNWDQQAWNNASPDERQRMLTIQIARERAARAKGKR
jgi:hypothetical protein